MKRLLCISCFAIALLGIMALPSNAADYTWLSGGTQAFTTSTNWTPTWSGGTDSDLWIGDNSLTTSPIINTDAGTINMLNLGIESTFTTTGGRLTIQNGGLLTVNNKIDVGIGGGVTGASTLAMTGGVLTQASGDFRVGVLNNTGTIDMSGTSTINKSGGEIIVGAMSNGIGELKMGGNSVLNLTNAALKFGGYPSAGGDAIGTLTMTGKASITQTGNSAFYGWGVGTRGYLDMTGTTTVGGNCPSITNSGHTYIGIGGGQGTATITNASYTSAGHLFVGYDDGKGTLNINGDSVVNVTSWIPVGHRDAAGAIVAEGTVNMNGGTLTKANVAGTYVALGMGGTGTWNQNGGTAIINAPTVLGQQDVGVDNLGGTGILNLNGGVYSTTRIYNGFSGEGNAHGRINFNGGTLQVNTNGFQFIAGGEFLVPRNATDMVASVQEGGAIIDTNTATIIVPVGLMHDDTVGAPAIDGGLTKTGPGTMILSGAYSTYTGPTVIEQGTLNLNATSLASPSILVQADATLAGKGYYYSTSATVEMGGTIAPGTIYEPLYLNNLNLGDGSKLHFQVDSSSADQIQVVGAVLPYDATAAVVTVSYTGSIAYDTDLLVAPSGISENLTFQLPGGKTVLDSDDGINSIVSVAKEATRVYLKAGGQITDPAWNYMGTGNWSDNTKWGNPAPNPAPNGGGDRAMFTDPAVSGDVTVNLNVSPQVSSMIFSSWSGAYTIAPVGTNSITLKSDIALNWHLTVLGGAHTVAADLKLAKGTDQSAIRTAVATSLTLSGDLSDLVVGESAGINFEGNGDGKSYAPTYGTLALGGLNTFTGPVVMTEYGRLEIGNIGLTTVPNALGQSGPAASNLKINGILAYTGTASGSTTVTTDRGFTLTGPATDPYNNGINNYIEVADADVNLVFNGQLAIEGYSMMTKSGPGTLTFANSGTNTLANCNLEVGDGSLVLENGIFNKVRENIQFQNGWGDLLVGTTAGITPSLVVKNNATLNLNNASELLVGVGSGIAGTASIESGATVHASSHVFLGNAGNGVMTVGSNSTTTETLSVGGILYVGYQAGQGVLNIKKGANITVASSIPVGHRDGAVAGTAQGTVNMSGGTITAGTGNQIYALLGMGGTGTWNQTGGVATINGPTVFGENNADTGGGIGILNLDGGVYSTSKLYNGWTGTGNAKGRVNFDGGTLQVNPNGWEFGNNGPFVVLRDAPDFVITIEDGGAIIDTNGQNQSFATVPFTHDSTLGTTLDGGLRKIGEGLLHVLVTPTYNGDTTVENGQLVLQDATLSTPNADLVVTGDSAMAVYISEGSTVDPSVTVANVTVDSTASLSVQKALTASGTVSVYDSATLTAHSIVADTLIIGGTAPDAGAASASAVPEPCTVILLAIAALGMFAVMWRKK